MWSASPSHAHAEEAAAPPFVGAWKVDTAKFMDMSQFAELSPEEKAAAAKEAAKELDTFSVEWTATHWSVTANGDTKRAVYKVKSKRGGSFVLEVQPPEGEAGESESVNVELSGETLYLEMPGLGKLPLARSGPAPKPAASTAAPAEAKPLLGKWGVDLATFRASDDYKKLMEGEEGENATKVAEEILSSMSAEFGADGSLVLSIGGEVQRGKFTVLRVNGNRFTIASSDADGSGEQTSIIELDGDKMQMMSGKQTLYFKRK
jgi:hypothetical protein